MPEITPEDEPTVAMPADPGLLQVPEKGSDKVMVVPGQTDEGPAIVPALGRGSITIVLVDIVVAAQLFAAA